MFLLVNNRPIQSADSIGFWPIVSVSADSQNSTIGRPLPQSIYSPQNYSKMPDLTTFLCVPELKTKEFNKVHGKKYVMFSNTLLDDDPKR